MTMTWWDERWIQTKRVVVVQLDCDYTRQYPNVLSLDSNGLRPDLWSWKLLGDGRRNGPLHFSLQAMRPVM